MMRELEDHSVGEKEEDKTNTLIDYQSVPNAVFETLRSVGYALS